MKVSLLILLLIGFSNLFAQVDSLNTKDFNFLLTDSSKFVGSIIFEDDNVIQINLLSGSEIRISKNSIVRQTKINTHTNSYINKSNITKHEEDSVDVFEDPTRSKLFIAPTAISPKAGAVSIGTHELLLPYFSVGITDWLSFSTSTYLLPLSTGFLVLSLQANVLSYKFSNISVGVLESFSYSFPSFNQKKWKNYFYGVYTFCNTNYMINIGLVLLPSTDIMPGITGIDESVLFFGGEIKLNYTSKIITDNWIFSNGISIYSIGLRSFSKSFSFDLGLIALFGEYKEDVFHSSTTEFNGVGVWFGFAFHF